MRGKLIRPFALAATLVALVAVAPAAVPSSPPTATAYAAIGDCTPGSEWGTLREDYAAEVVQLVNQHRDSLGLSQLQTTSPLTNSAVWKSRHMAYYRYMAHDDPAPPVARTVGDRLLACGYPANSAGWGENIAYGYTTPTAVMQAWLNSPGHRQNIEGPSYRTIGVAAAAASNGTLYWTQQFGTSAGDSGTPPSPPPPAPEPPPPPPAPPSYACSNNADDDGDGKVDYPADPGCTSSSDDDEYNAETQPPAPSPPPPPEPPVPAPPAPTPSAQCSNGRDDDGDSRIDYPADRGCSSPADTTEFNFWFR